jgi:hypothetical protein
MWFLRLTINKKIGKYVLAVIVLARIICRWTKSVKLFLTLIFVCNQLKSGDIFDIATHSFFPISNNFVIGVIVS